ncbi:glycoside hydrolase family 43 protein [Paenibacillus ginsengarvi]|uniref:Glycoside hydrolase n=1 Tax=Paenibacillus ginsengarvi TaxID=400777 RepID=A0A3B0CC86_9BACL|nr:glycoside hydrolase family 43 protein [Paenibacillus ginsengarvi]RKN83752.1 glycoside hydrolase [Paenibacillus ginsengarvi]
MITRDQLRIRDPFVLVDPEAGLYVMYGTNGIRGFDAYTSTDLENWDGPIPVLRPEEGFWADRDYWAPEVHLYRGRYYMLASLKAEEACRGTQVFVADSPLGPFRLCGGGPVTPGDWECLDGTLHIDEEGKPWMVFCHEWLQVHDGEMCAVPLDESLERATGEPVLLFKASEAPWSVARHTGIDYITDGPFLFRSGGELLMMWSSFGADGYALGLSRSISGKLAGPWTHDERPLYDKDGGHGMLFRDLRGEWMLTYHTPNGGSLERAVFVPFAAMRAGLAPEG